MPCLAQQACPAAWQAEHGPDSQVVLVTYDIAPAGLDVSAAAAADFRYRTAPTAATPPIRIVPNAFGVARRDFP